MAWSLNLAFPNKVNFDDNLWNRVYFFPLSLSSPPCRQHLKIYTLPENMIESCWSSYKISKFLFQIIFSLSPSHSPFVWLVGQMEHSFYSLHSGRVQKGTEFKVSRSEWVQKTYLAVHGVGLKPFRLCLNIPRRYSLSLYWGAELPGLLGLGIFSLERPGDDNGQQTSGWVTDFITMTGNESHQKLCSSYFTQVPGPSSVEPTFLVAATIVGSAH